LTTWHRGRRQVVQRRRLGAIPLATFVAGLTDAVATRVPGTAVYLAADPGATPSALEENLATHHAIHEVVYVVNVRLSDRARVDADQRAKVTGLAAGFHEVALTFGFMEQPDVPAALRRALPERDRPRLAEAVYFVGRETIVATAIPGMAIWRERLFVVLHRNASSVVRYFCLPRDRIVEVGSIIDI
jgi:KUP system potassium uptake protein